MRQAGLSALMLALAVGLGACSFPGETPAEKWIELLDTHRERLIAGEFDAEQFRLEGEPVARELARHVDEKKGKILLPEELIERWREANNKFEEAAVTVGNVEALAAYRELASHFTDFEED